jgi:hypothetical protein
MTERFFTVEEANRLLPRLGAILERLIAVRQEMAARHRTLEALRAHIRGNGATADGRRLATLRGELEAMARDLKQGIEEIEGYGCQIKDLDIGLIDFPTLREGEPVLLCWRLGEDRIGFWHRAEEGFAGRKPLGGDVE